MSALMAKVLNAAVGSLLKAPDRSSAAVIISSARTASGWEQFTERVYQPGAPRGLRVAAADWPVYWCSRVAQHPLHPAAQYPGSTAA